MQAIRIEGATQEWHAPKNWNAERDGPCSTLAVRHENVNGLVAMVSAWRPSPEEIRALVAGAPVLLTIIGGVHPPVAVRVGTAS